MALNDTVEVLMSKATDIAQAAARTAKTASTIAKARLDILAEQDKLKKAYVELGKLYYRDYITGEEPDDGEYLPLCDRITESTKAIDELRTTIDELKAEKEPAAEDEAVEAEVEEVSEPAEKTEEVVFEVVEDAPETPAEPETPEGE